MENSKKIVILTSEFPPQPGGIGNHAFHLANGLQKKGWQVEVLADQRSGSGSEEDEFDEQQVFSIVRTKRKKIIVLTYLDRIQKAFSMAKRSDVFLASGKFSLWLGGCLSLVSSKKFIAVIHGSEVLLHNPFLRKFTDFNLKRFDEVIAVSNYTKSLIENLRLKNVTVIPNGFKIENKKEETLKKSKPKNLRLITVGNVTRRKGQHNVINALPKLLEHYPKLEYHIVGIPTEKKRLEELAEKLQVRKNIIFHGKVSEGEKLDLLCEASVFVMLSEKTASGDVEGFGIAILEANALGVPGIGAKNCGIEDAIEDGFSGKLINPNATDEFLKALFCINKAYDNYSKNAQNWSTNFDWDTITERYIKTISIVREKT